MSSRFAVTAAAAIVDAAGVTRQTRPADITG
jgi:hypothetical protein